MGILDSILGRKDKPPDKKPDFSGVRTGSGSTLGEKAPEPERRPPTPERPPTPAMPPPTAASAGPRTYEVQSGDSLSKIAKQFYGNANEWPKIHEANRAHVPNPDLIHPGQKLIIP